MMRNFFMLVALMSAVIGVVGCQPKEHTVGTPPADIREEGGAQAASGTLEFNPNYKEPTRPK